jgi:hypothetical protein
MIRKSKTPDQERAGAQVAVPYARASDRSAVRALQAWLRMAGIHRGPVFRRMRRGESLDARLQITVLSEPALIGEEAPDGVVFVVVKAVGGEVDLSRSYGGRPDGCVGQLSID